MSSNTLTQEQCPVDHKSREAWLSQARAAASSQLPADHPPIPPPSTHPSPSDTTPGGEATAEKCPVDHKAREVWLQQARAAAAAASAGASENSRSIYTNTTPLAGSGSATNTVASSSAATSTSSSWTAYLPSFWSSGRSSGNGSNTSKSANTNDPLARLATDREVSTIPRTATSSYPESYSAAASEPLSGLPTSASPSPFTTTPITPIPKTNTPQPTPPPPPPSTVPAAAAPPPPPSHGSTPANSEQETGADTTSGNWIYPSERMFFEAMRRKGHDPRLGDMRAVVPIHNAVNERAWAEIKAWEAPWIARQREQQQGGPKDRDGGGICDGPRLHSFSGLGGDKLSPRARFNTLLGYQAPFDRHDWVVDRCGTRVEYVIDFYAGRGFGGGGGGGEGGAAGVTGGAKPLSFYLDIRPKLNSWEGVKMRALRGLGLV